MECLCTVCKTHCLPPVISSHCCHRHCGEMVCNLRCTPYPNQCNEDTTLRGVKTLKRAKQVIRQQVQRIHRGRRGGGEERGGAGEPHNELTLALVVVGFHRCCSVACRGTAAAPGPYDLFHRAGLRDDPPTGQTHCRFLFLWLILLIKVYTGSSCCTPGKHRGHFLHLL